MRELIFQIPDTELANVQSIRTMDDIERYLLMKNRRDLVCGYGVINFYLDGNTLKVWVGSTCD